ncbi:MAG TPA: 30S ribosomal protein S6 [bacterium]|jgi:small subunit ribosomal protein S6|nr:30S ribosomal protein S6 [bacterium]
MSNLLKYDVIYILDPNSTTEEMTAVSAKVEQVVTDSKGTVLKKDDWGKRRLAYMVKKHREGHYVFFHLSLSTEAIAEVTRNLRLMEKVIKYSVVKDTISHLKAKVKPPRVKTSTESSSTHRPSSQRHPGSSHSPSHSHSSSAPTNPAPKAPEAPAAAAATVVPAAPSPAPTNP